MRSRATPAVLELPSTLREAAEGGHEDTAAQTGARAIDIAPPLKAHEGRCVCRNTR
jgi:hypothetical protein